MLSSFTIEAFIWDLDGVITNTSYMHHQAWRTAIQSYFKYEMPIDDIILSKCFDGVPRPVGIKRFLDIYEHTWFEKSDSSQIEHLAKEIAKEKNIIFKEMISTNEIEVFSDAISLMKSSKEHGIKMGLSSQSENADHVLDRAGIRKYFDACATGITAKNSGTPNKPDPKFYIHAANLLGVDIRRCIVFEDTYAGAYSAVSAGALRCLGVARNTANTMELISAGCDIVARELSGIGMIMNIG